MKLKEKVSLFNIIVFNFRIIFYEKSFLILNVLLLLLPILFGATFSFLQKGDQIVIYFNFYILVYVSLFIFLVVLRSLQFFLTNILENKLLYLVFSNQVSRTKMLVGQLLLVFIMLALNISTSCVILIAAGAIFTDELELLIRLNVSFLVYAIISAFFLMTFIMVLLLFTSIQITTIICTLLISLTFLSNIPRQFVDAKESQLTVSFNYNDGQIYKVTDLHDAFDLQKYILNYQIKYPHLSYALNDYLVTQNQFTVESFALNDTISRRIDEFWKSLGVIKEEQISITSPVLILQSLPFPKPSDMSDWNANISTGDKIVIDLNLEKTFISQDELRFLAFDSSENEGTKLIIKDLYYFLENIIVDIPAFANWTADYFKDYIFLATDEDGISTSKVRNITRSSEAVLKKEHLNNLYKFEVSSSPSLVNNGFTVVQDGSNNSKTFVNDQLYFPLMLASRLLEEYFINYTSKYVVASTYSRVANDGWSEYISVRGKFIFYDTLNFFNGIWSNYTQMSGFSYDSFWFENHSTSKIYLGNQKNIFLSYKSYIFTLDENEVIYPTSYNNYVSPWYYMLIQLFISIFFIALAFNKYIGINLR